MSSSSSSDVTNEPTLSEAQDSLVGKKLGKYTIVERVAKGGTATVYRALDNVLNREVAIKLLHEHLEARKDVVERFRNEAKVVAQLRHVNVVTVYDFFEHEGRAALVVEFMPGITLSALVKSIPRIPEDYVLMLAMEMLQGLKAAHQKSITHRDIKPANILIHPELGVKISDFGLAKFTNQDDGFTKEGIFVGTPSFSSPEQIEGRPLDQRSDIFSLGLVLYLLATRTHAFKQQGDSTTTVWFKIVRGSFDPAQKKNPDLSDEFERILSRALEVDLTKRYANVDLMIADIDDLLKRRGLFPYNEALRSFLKDPAKASFVIRGKRQKLKRAITKTVLAGAAAALLGGGIFWWKSRSEKVISESSPSAAPSATASPSVPELVPPPPPPSVIEPDVIVKPKVAATPKKVEPVTSKPREESLPEASIPSAKLISDRALLVLVPFESSPGYKIAWKEPARLVVAKDREFSKMHWESDRLISQWVFKDLAPGSFYWRAGEARGQFDVESFDAYRNRFQGSKSQLVVAAQFGDVDVQLNPWTQNLKMTWQNGPDAASYRIEVAKDLGFTQILFSGSEFSKASVLERFWDSDQTIYWRVSYLDESKNVFLIDPPHRISIQLKGTPKHFEVISPRPNQSVGTTVEVLAGSPSAVKCTSVAREEISTEVVLLKESQRSFLAGKIPFPSKAQWLSCESRVEGREVIYTIPLRNEAAKN